MMNRFKDLNVTREEASESSKDRTLWRNCVKQTKITLCKNFYEFVIDIYIYTYTFTRLFIYLFIYSFIHSFIHLFIYTTKFMFLEDST